MLNRRAFLQRFGIGVTAALALAALPASAIAALDTTEAGKRLACEFLRKRFNAYMRGKRWDRMPLSMRVPRGLFEAFEGELVVMERFGAAAHVGERHLMFKGTMLFADPTMPATWDVRFTDAPPQGVEYAMNTTGALLA